MTTISSAWTRRGVLAAGGVGAALAAWPARSALATGTPESVGLRSAGLAALNAEMRTLVAQQQLAGVVTLLARKGQIVNLDACGRQDVAAPAPMTPTSIFRIASMTKPIIGAAMMQLYEQGKWRLDDPVHSHIPEFAGLKVRTADGGLVDQKHAMTMAQLVSHNAGFGGNADYAGKGLQDGDLKLLIDRLARLPLHSQPGSEWLYGPVVDIQGYLIEKFSGQSLDQYLQAKIFTPLRMPDTQFWVRASALDRVARVHSYQDGRIVPGPDRPTPTGPPKYLSGSGGLFSTAPDYFRFAQALLQEGQIDGVRILRAESVRIMRTNLLPKGVRVQVTGPMPDNGLGFGVDVATSDRPETSDLPYGRGSFWWPGALGTAMWIDPANEIVFIGMIQNVNGGVPGGGSPPLRVIWPKAVYGALIHRKT